MAIEKKAPKIRSSKQTSRFCRSFQTPKPRHIEELRRMTRSPLPQGLPIVVDADPISQRPHGQCLACCRIWRCMHHLPKPESRALCWVRAPVAPQPTTGGSMQQSSRQNQPSSPFPTCSCPTLQVLRVGDWVCRGWVWVKSGFRMMVIIIPVNAVV